MKVPKVRPQVSVCFKCKYCVKRKHLLRIPEVGCRTPSDPVGVDFVSGKKTYVSYRCAGRNLYGTCEHYKKVWYRKGTYMKRLLGIFLLVACLGCAPEPPQTLRF